MKRSKKVAIIGHFAEGTDICDGQTVKTRILYDELKRATDWKLKKVDTYEKAKRPAKLLFDTLSALLSTKDIIVLLSRNGMRLYFPILYLWGKVTGGRVYHDVIGGNLDKLVLTHPKFKKHLSSFKVNWVETKLLKEKLAEIGIINCDVIPNFKRLECAINEPKTVNNGDTYKFCTFSRVVKEKGIEEAINAVETINEEAGRQMCTLDIYGPVGDDYKVRFDEVMSKVSSAIKYCGTVPYDKSVETIKDYYALLFPTYWEGEGFPGTIVDAFSAGVPVIASDWNCNAEIVEDGETGMLYPREIANSLEEAVLWSIENKDEFVGMRQRCTEKAQEYMPEKYIEKIISQIEGNE